MKKQRLIGLIALFLLLPFVSEAQISTNAPFDGNSFTITHHNSQSITMKVPIYDDRDLDRWVKTGYIEYSVNGEPYRTLVEIKEGKSSSQMQGNWYHAKMQKGFQASGRVTTEATYKNTVTFDLSTSFIGYEYYTENRKSNSPTYAKITWFHPFTSDAVIVIRFRGDIIAQNGLMNTNQTWYSGRSDSPRAILLGNPLTKPVVSSHEFLSDGKVKITPSVPGYTAVKDMGTEGVDKNGLFLRMKSVTGLNTIPFIGVAPFILNYNSSNAEGRNFITNTKLTEQQFNNGDQIQIGSLRQDFSNGFTYKYSDVYILPPYPQPSSLQARGANGKH